MNKFTFSLQKVLDYRTTQKKQAAAALAELDTRRAEAEARLQALADQWQKERAALEAAESGLVAAEYQMRMAYIEYIDGKIEQEREKLTGVVTEMAEARQRLVKCTQDERVLEMLRNRKMAKHAQELRRSESAAVDELVSQRAAYKMAQTPIPAKYVQ